MAKFIIEQHPDMTLWTGRDDTIAEGPHALRWHQRVTAWKDKAPPGVVLMGFASDEGIRRNQGRVGAADGPRAIRRALAHMAWRQEHPVYDAGDVTCPGGELEAAQERLAVAISKAIVHGHRPLLLGGGHETAWGTYHGLVRAFPGKTIGIVNVDAHFDLRQANQSTSGTPFAQMADWCRQNGRPFRYLALGISEAGNTAAGFDRAKELGVTWRTDCELNASQIAETLALLETFVHGSDLIHLSIDLDVLPAATMPAVSAPAARGIALECVEQIIETTAKSDKLTAADIVEFNPICDGDGCAARVAAGLVWKIARDWRSAPVCSVG